MVLLIKGKAIKTKIIGYLAEKITCKTIVYNNYPINFLEGIFIPSKNYDLSYFYSYLEDKFDTLYNNFSVIIYTNNTEKELNKIIKLAEKQERLCIITCKE